MKILQNLFLNYQQQMSKGVLLINGFIAWSLFTLAFLLVIRLPQFWSISLISMIITRYNFGLIIIKYDETQKIKEDD